MRVVLTGKRILNRVPCWDGFKLCRNRPFCSSTHNSKPATSDSGGSSNNGSSSNPSLSTYSEQYKALDNLDFMTATKILFSESPKKKKFGYVFSFYLGILSNRVFALMVHVSGVFRAICFQLPKAHFRL